MFGNIALQDGPFDKSINYYMYIYKKISPWLTATYIFIGANMDGWSDRVNLLYCKQGSNLCIRPFQLNWFISLYPKTRPPHWLKINIFKNLTCNLNVIYKHFIRQVYIKNRVISSFFDARARKSVGLVVRSRSSRPNEHNMCLETLPFRMDLPTNR